VRKVKCQRRRTSTLEEGNPNPGSAEPFGIHSHGSDATRGRGPPSKPVGQLIRPWPTPPGEIGRGPRLGHTRSDSGRSEILSQEWADGPSCSEGPEERTPARGEGEGSSVSDANPTAADGPGRTRGEPPPLPGGAALGRGQQGVGEALALPGMGPSRIPQTREPGAPAGVKPRTPPSGSESRTPAKPKRAPQLLRSRNETP
jgi:hypothetical protein